MKNLEYVVTDSESESGKFAWYLVDGGGIMRTESSAYKRKSDANRAAERFIRSIGLQPVRSYHEDDPEGEEAELKHGLFDTREDIEKRADAKIKRAIRSQLARVFRGKFGHLSIRHIDDMIKTLNGSTLDRMAKTMERDGFDDVYNWVTRVYHHKL